jgi:hypothetical protein
MTLRPQDSQAIVSPGSRFPLPSGCRCGDSSSTAWDPGGRSTDVRRSRLSGLWWGFVSECVESGPEGGDGGKQCRRRRLPNGWQNGSFSYEKKQKSCTLLSENKRDIQLHVDKAHILRKGGRWIWCRLQGGGLDDVLPRREKDRGWQGYDK